ncbi:MAG: ribosomal RNA small subunit methyltransferase A [Candidatus Omnitrophica bacterium]|nr:ribosomal RNA small subunit methyltransferase A [Candidatus Omnitrophota bacterium]
MKFKPFHYPSQDSKIHRAKKYLGQNFLIDPHIIERIIESCQLSKEETIIEIGPGTGALTRHLKNRVKTLIAIEKDKALAASLTKELAGSNVKIIEGDFLELDLASIVSKTGPIKLIGNLPYYISTPILTKVIEQRKHVTNFYLTVQREFAQRLGAHPGTKEYGSLSCFVQYYARVQPLFLIKSTCFKPRPKVDSGFLRINIRQVPEYPSRDEQFLFQVIRQGFNQRRKTLLNALSVIISKARLEIILNAMGLNIQARAEQLSLEKFVLLAQEISKDLGSSVQIKILEK